MFNEFEQVARKSGDCTADCNDRKYLLQARHYVKQNYSVFTIKDEVIVTYMKRFYMSVNIATAKNGYQGSIFVGISFINQKDSKVESKEEKYE